MSEKLTEEQKRKNLSDEVVKLRREGKVIIFECDELNIYDVKSLTNNQPVEGLLYDLNRDAVTCATWIAQSDDPVWVNNFASGVVIEYLHNDRAALQQKYDLLLSEVKAAMEEIEKVGKEKWKAYKEFHTGPYDEGYSDGADCCGDILRKHIKEELIPEAKEDKHVD